MKRNVKQNSIFRLALGTAILILLNVIASFVFTRFDLTSEKRFTLSKPTKEMLKKLNDVVYVKVYLEGEFPSGFKRLRNSTKEMLDEFRVYAGDYIQYEFIDPSASKDAQERNKFYQQIASLGLQPTNLEVKENGGTSQQIIFPGAVFYYRNMPFAVQLLKDQIGTAPEEMLNNSIQTLEYELGNTIRKATQSIKPVVLFLTGHGESEQIKILDIAHTLGENYDVDTVSIRGQLKSLDNCKLLIVANPIQPFDEKDKFIIDRFVMRGGKILWLIDMMDATMDSLSGSNITLSLARDLNLEDMFFKYGFRVNPNLILDLQSAPIPIVTSIVGNQPQQRLIPWYYFPLIFPLSGHPIVRNLNAIRCEFVNSIDTVETDGIIKTILLSTSRLSRIVFSPARVSISILEQEPDKKQFNKEAQPIAVLLEGNFSSLYANRIPADIASAPEIKFKEKSVPTKMIVIADGDMIENKIRKSAGGIYPLGYDKFTNEVYGNKSFLLNCIDYMLDENGLIAARTKLVKLRLLDKTKLKENKEAIGYTNAVLPLLLVMLLGGVKYYLRKRKYR
ncbi:MAG TPA: gliding motility-associated ABC transporter substrate-binding protein GldG [Bacteroidia bacterium]|nr:gliding motility-associated ABC transporter substrate-binding protein GldG [Bacteroidia bacterium]